MAVTRPASAPRLPTVRPTTRREYIISAAIVAAAVAIAWIFAATVLAHVPRMGLPLDDSYIYLTYAKQFGRGQPFSYYPGGGYSAGSTSVLWPMLLAPFWTLGARGHALVWVSFALCAALYAATAVGAFRVVRRIAGEAAGIAAAVIVLALSAYAWSALSGMEVALAGALAVATVVLLLDEPSVGPPRLRLVVVLAALSLSRPELTVVVAGVVAASAWQRRRDWRAALRWGVPLVPMLAWCVANRALAGHWFPNTGVVKSHFYLPGFDWAYWLDAVGTQLGSAARGMFIDAGPLGPSRIVGALWLVGSVRIALWGRAANRRLCAAVMIGTPVALLAAVIATSGAPWSFQGYRYIAPLLPLVAIACGCAFAPIRRVPWGATSAAAIVVAVVVAGFAIVPMRDDALYFAQGAADTDAQVCTIGGWLADHRPGARVLFHDAGAIAYYGDTEVFDMLGLVTNGQAGVANNGPGARFEELEAMPAAQRPDVFAYYPDWLGTNDFYGDVRVHTPLPWAFLPAGRARLAGGGDMEVIDASWDHAGTAERPLAAQPGWTMVDRVDVADLASERAHGWHGGLGRRSLGDPTAKWSFVEREVGARGLAIDGGRTIREGSEQFVVAVAPGKPVRLILRSGGAPNAPYQDRIDHPVAMTVRAGGAGDGARATIAPPRGAFVEIAFDLPAPDGAELPIDVQADGPYRAFHWFALQP
jgi:hypothetical protein